VIRCHGAILTWVFACLVISGCGSPPQGTPLYEPGKPFDTGMLQVSEIHRIHYQLFGTLAAPPVMILHGGPGYGVYPRLLQFFDPLDFFIVAHDQRGCGLSEPVGELRENTTQDLIADIEKLRLHLGIDDVVLFGGGWGSTLALAYAEAHPEHVSGLLLYAVFTATQREFADQLETGRLFYPSLYDGLERAMPERERPITPAAISSVINGSDEKVSTSVLDAWNRLFMKRIRIFVDDRSISEYLNSATADQRKTHSRIYLHYAANDFFVEDGQLERDAERLSQIPTIIVNSRFDMLYPPAAASRLHRSLRDSELRIVERSGHSESEPAVVEALIEAVEVFDRYSG